MSFRILGKATKIGPYLWARSQLPSPGSQNLTFLTLALPHYNPIGGGYQNMGPNGGQIVTQGGFNYPGHLVGIVGPGGVLTGQVFNPPLINTGS